MPVDSAKSAQAARFLVTGVFVWSVWAALFAGDLALVARYGSNVPFLDEWVSVPVLTGNEPVTVQWLWSQHNEHRFVLPRLVYVALYKLTNDFRAAMVFNVTALAGLAAAMIGTSRRLRGRSSWTDAFLPLTLLHPGQSENLLWGWQIGLVIPTVLAGVILLAALASGGAPSMRSALLAGSCIVLLPLCGGIGLAMTPSLALWLSYCGIALWKSDEPQGRPGGAWMLAMAAVALLAMGLYWIKFQRPAGTESPGLAASVMASWQFLTLAFGMVLRPFWWAWGAVILALILVTLAVLRQALRDPAERARALGLMMFLIGIGLMAIGVGWGRAGFGLASRYTTLAAPLLCAIYFVVLLYARRGSVRLIPAGLCAIAFLMIGLNTYQGLRYARFLREEIEVFELDVAAATPPMVLVDRYTRFPFILCPDRHGFSSYLAMLRARGVEVFRNLAADPVFRVTPLTSVVATRVGDHLFVLREPQYVYALRLKYQYSPPRAREALFVVSWRSLGERGLKGAHTGSDVLQSAPRSRPEVAETIQGQERTSQVRLLQDAKECSLLVWLGTTLDRIGIFPDNKPCSCSIWDIELLVPDKKR